MPSIVQSGRVNVDITFLDEDDSMVTVTANRFELLEGYTSAYARTRRIDRSKLRFMLRGTEVKDNLTLDDMGCIGNDIIELYILARGGVCLYSGSPRDIEAHLARIGPSLEPVHSLRAPFPIEQLIKYSCSNHQDLTVQQLCRVNNEQFQGSERQLAEHVHLVPDGIQRNRPRFSLHSCTVLALRFLSYIRGHLWKEYLFTLLNYLAYAGSLMIFFKPQIIFASGCVNPEDDLNNTCTKSLDAIEDELLLADNLRYSYFFTNLYLFILVLSTSFIFFSEFKYFENEHRNGWYSSGSFYLIKSGFEILTLIPLNIVYVYLVDIYAPVVPTGTFWPLFSILTLAAIALQGLAHCFSLLGGGNLTLQSLILICVYLLMLFLGNFYVPFSRLHYVYQLLSNFSVSRFSWEAIMLLLYGFGRCRPNEFQSVLYTMAIDDGHYHLDVAMILVNLVLYRILALLLLVWRMNPPENRQKRVSRISRYIEKVHSSTSFIL